MDEKQIEFLEQLQHEMLTQDTVSQADPRFWVVQGTIKEYGYESEYADGYVIVLDCETTIESMEEAYEWLKEKDRDTVYGFEDGLISYYSKKYEENTSLDDLEEVCEYIEAEKIGIVDICYPYISHYKNVEKIYSDTFFLTNDECKDHIERNYYHYSEDAHSYAMTAWRSPQVEMLYKILQTVDWKGTRRGGMQVWMKKSLKKWLNWFRK